MGGTAWTERNSGKAEGIEADAAPWIVSQVQRRFVEARTCAYANQGQAKTVDVLGRARVPTEVSRAKGIQPDAEYSKKPPKLNRMEVERSRCVKRSCVDLRKKSYALFRQIAPLFVEIAHLFIQMTPISANRVQKLAKRTRPFFRIGPTFATAPQIISNAHLPYSPFNPPSKFQQSAVPPWGGG